ncbi:MAG: hypothetical protein K8R88_09045 [Armatimonadetes bacterium]|nr:hypothetical protein [Armatimonadota bacterium]
MVAKPNWKKFSLTILIVGFIFGAVTQFLEMKATRAYRDARDPILASLHRLEADDERVFGEKNGIGLLETEKGRKDCVAALRVLEKERDQLLTKLQKLDVPRRLENAHKSLLALEESKARVMRSRTAGIESGDFEISYSVELKK